MKKSLLALSFLAAAVLSGCASFTTDHSAIYAEDELATFAYDLGRTHAGLARCKDVDPEQLDAHLESARIALKGQTGARATELAAVFEQGLHEPADFGRRLHIDCSCANELVRESRRHNLQLYRAVTVPKAFRQAANS